MNNAYFTLEKSNDAMNWKDIATVAGAGNSTHLINYVADDESPSDGISYYLLKQTDYDGKFSYSSVIPVTGCNISAFNVVVFPNPTDAYANVFIHSDEAQSSLLRIYNSIGQVVYSASIPAKRENILQIPAYNLIDGLYNVALDSDYKSFHTKLIVQH